MFTEKNIPNLIFSVPFIGILLTTLLFTTIIINNEYRALKNDTKKIRENYILDEKKVLKGKITEVLNFIKNSSFKDNEVLLKKETLNYIENIIAKDNGYIYIIDDKANVISHPVLKKGSNTSALKDINGFKIAENLIRVGKNYPEGDFITYYWTKPNETIPKEKTAFVYCYKKWNWIIAIGGYMDVVEKEILQKIKEREAHLSENVIHSLYVAIIITILIFIFAYYFSKTINKIFKDYKISVFNKEEELKKLNRRLVDKADNEVFKRSKKEEELEVAYKEILTGLPNRMKLIQELKNSTSPKLAIFNIDRFTDVNFCYSTVVGDRLLIEITRLLTNLFKKNKEVSIFKFSADEFGVYSNSEEFSNKKFIDTCLYAIEQIEKKPFVIGNNNIFVSVTSGIALTKNDLIINADAAVKIAKQRKKRFVVYGQEDNIVNYQNNIKWVQILKNAILKDRVVVFAQPIVDNNNSNIKKYECLIRIKDEENEIISPFHFLELSKKLKLYPELTKIVVEKSFNYFTNSTAEFSINLTLDDILNKETVLLIKSKLINKNVANRTIFEIVESEGIDSFEEVSLFIKEMKEFGCKIAIDDFGTGYSNFEYLMKLNVDYIKIDGSFIKNIDKCKQSLLIAELILTFAKKQNIKTVAEYVHSKDVLDKVKGLGIDYSQGYYCGEPQEIKS